MTALLIDSIRRRWGRITLLALQLVTMCRALWSNSSWLDEVAVSVGVSAFVATQTQDWLTSREITQLPVSRRALWLTRWWATVPLTSLFVVSGVYFALWSTRRDEWSWGGTATALVYCVADAGAGQ